MFGKLLVRLGSRCRRVPRQGGRRPPHSGRGSHGCPGSTEHRLGCSLWQRNISGGALQPHHFPDDSYRPSRIQEPEKVEKIKYWEPEATGWTHFGGVHQGAVSLTAAEVQLHVYPGPSLSDMEGKKKRRRQPPVPPPFAGFSLQHGRLSAWGHSSP